MRPNEIMAAMAMARGMTAEQIFADQIRASRARTAATAALSPAEREKAFARATGRHNRSTGPAAIHWDEIHAKVAAERGQPGLADGTLAQQVYANRAKARAPAVRPAAWMGARSDRRPSRR
jgi:hypothetical protein